MTSLSADSSRTVSERYPALWKFIHWLMALLVIGLIIVGFIMANRAEANIWDDLTNVLFAWHKAIGFAMFFLIAIRIVIRRRHGMPAYSSSVSPELLKWAHQAHTLLYTLLIAVPLLGWAAVTAYPALITVGGYHLPAMPGIPKDQDLAKQLFEIHGWLAYLLAALIAVHIAGALKHLLIDRDGVFQRMWFGQR